MRKLERSVEQSFVRACKRRGVWRIKLGFNTFPDQLVFLRTGRVVFVEMKRPGETLRPNQVSRVKKLRKYGFEVHVIEENEKAIALAKALSKENQKAGN